MSKFSQQSELEKKASKELATKYNKSLHPQMIKHLGIEFIEVSGQKMVARMPIDERTVQPMGLLHGGASCVLAETLGSIGASLNAGKNKVAIGIEINANHLTSATKGYAIGVATPIRAGKGIQVWETQITDDKGNLLCVSRLTVAIKEARAPLPYPS